MKVEHDNSKHPLTDVKVFISSTFSDLDKERNYISQVIFNSLRDTYKGLSINEIDLRWGITEEQANNGRVIDLCLQYIHESKPFFIGILGDRYGTSFHKKNVTFSPVVEEYFPQATEDVEKNSSATEIEILNGVLRNPEARAIFFIKKDARPYPGETQDQWARLEKLKSRIRATSHKVVEYSSLEDFDVIKDFIKENIGSPDLYTIPAEGMERADKISRLHFERSLSYIREVPYDPRLDNLLQKIDDTVSKSKEQTGFIGIPGVGKSTTLAYMAHHFSGERIYIPLYGDIDDLPSTTDEILVFLKNSLKNAIYKSRHRKSKWHQFKEWFRDGLKEIDYDNPDDLYKEFLRHKWCFILDNYESSEWLSYPGFGEISFNKLKQIYDKILFFFNRISNHYHKPFDMRRMVVRDMDKEAFNKYVSWKQSEPVFDLNMHWWFNASEYVSSFMKEHGKSLSRQQLDAIVNNPIRWLPGSMRLICQYMAEFIKYEEINTFLDDLRKIDWVYYAHKLYLEKICILFHKDVAVRAMTLLMIFRSGIPLKEFEKQMELIHTDFLSLMRMLSPFIVYTGEGVRLRDFMLEHPIKEILGITQDMVIRQASQLSDQYHKELFEDMSLDHFKKVARTSFLRIAPYFDSEMPLLVSQEWWNIMNPKRRVRSTNPIELRDLKLRYWRMKYWMSGGHLTDEVISKVFQKVSASGITDWALSDEGMYNYLQTSYAAHRQDRLMSVVHNPHFIKKMWNSPLYLFIWDTYLMEDGEFAAPYSQKFSRESYEIKPLIRIMDMLMHTFYTKVLKPRLNEKEFKFVDIYLKNYPKK